jgi:hypothetical protein
MAAISEEEQRIIDIIEKQVDPENVAEEILLYMYEGSVEGVTMKQLMLSLPPEFDPYDIEHLTMVIVGYTEGQLDLLENKNAIGEVASYNKH